MPQFTVTSPDGRQIRLTGDRPPTRDELEQIFATLDTPQASAREALRAQTQQDILRQQAFETSPLEAGLVAAGRGLTTIARAVGLAEPEDPLTRQAFENLQQEAPVATTVGEIAGESAPFLLPGLGAGAAATRLGGGALARGVTAGALGAAEGAAIARGRGGNIDEQLTAGGLGGLTAAAIELVLPRLGRLGGRIFRRVRGRAPQGALVDATGNPSQEFVEALAESGQTFDDVVQQATRELREEALEPREAARQTFLRSQGIEPTRAQISRNAADFQAQQEAAKTSNAVRQALEEQEAFLTSRFDNAVLDTAGRANLPTSSVVDAVTGKATRLDREISDLYRIAREAAPTEKNVRFSTTANTLRRLAPRNTPAGGVIKTIRDDLRQRGVLNKRFKATGRIDVETAEEVRKLANQLFDPANPFGNAQLRTIKDAIDDDVFRAAGRDVFERGRQAKAAFENELSRAKVSKFDTRKANLVRDVLENRINPDTMVQDVVLSKKWRASDVEQLRDYMTAPAGTVGIPGSRAFPPMDIPIENVAGIQAFNDLRAEVLQTIKDRSFIGPEDAQGFRALSRDKLQRVLEQIGPQKRAVLFSPDENRFLDDMLEVSRLREPVRGTALGRGPSAQAIGRLERTIERIPGLAEAFRVIRTDLETGPVLRARVGRIAQPIEFSPIRTAAGVAGVAATQQDSE